MKLHHHCVALLGLAGVLLLGACSPYAGVSVPVGPVRLGVGLGAGGISANVGTGIGPLGAGIGVHSSGQVSGHAGVGASVPLGGAQVGAGLGTSTVLRPAGDTPSMAPVDAPVNAQGPAAGAVQWRDARGQLVPACRVQGGC